MNFTLKGIKEIKANAEVTLTRAIQFTGEKLGHCERTELDGFFEKLINDAEQIISWNEEIVKSVEVLANLGSNVEPSSSSNKLEEFFTEKLATKVQEKRTEHRFSNLEWFGNNLLAFGQNLTSGDTYGSALIDSGQTELIVGQIEREFATKIEQQFIEPLKFDSAENARALSREKRSLEIKRLDLDVTKNKFNKVMSTDQPQIPSLPYEQIVKELNEVKDELEKAQTEFDNQAKVVSNICTNIINSSDQYAGYLSKFIQAQSEFYYQANQNMKDLLDDKRIMKSFEV